MDNRKLLKFLYKDIAEIEELVAEKGAEGFDEFEIEFIQSRFKGAKQLIQILSEKENKQLKKIRPRPIEKQTVVEEEDVNRGEGESLQSQSQSQCSEEDEVPVVTEPKLTEEEGESLKSLADFEEELKEESVELKTGEEQEVVSEAIEDTKELKDEPNLVGTHEPEVFSTPEVVEEEKSVDSGLEAVAAVEEEEEKDEANNRLGDRFSHDKSVNDLMGNGADKLEYKISNSPVDSIQTAIGINDRYQYIRELFDGDADEFTKAVTELDKQENIQAAVSYLQANYKWKKNDISLKFVNLVKRRFPNG